MFHPRARTMLILSVSAILIGTACSLFLIDAMKIAALLQRVLWSNLPTQLGISADSPLWIIAMLTATGIAVGLIVHYNPGHAGPDPTTESLIGTPIATSALPGLLVALILGLAGGVSFGPEHPIMVVNITLAVAVDSRLFPRVSSLDWTILAASGTIGTLPDALVATALILSQALNSSDEPLLRDRFSAPLFAAATGALTVGLFFHPHLTLPIPHYDQMYFADTTSGTIVALTAVAVGVVAIWCLPCLHALMHRLRNPIPTPGIGGLLLGIPGVISDSLTLLKGLDKMQQLTFSQTLTAADFLFITFVKLVTLVLASASSFRGGRTSPVVFAEVALGLMLHAHVGVVPAAVTVFYATFSMVLVATRGGWLSLLMAAVVVPDTTLLPLLCIMILPVWLLLAGRPLMIAKRTGD